MIRHGYDQESEPMSRLLGSSPHVEDMRYPSESRYGLFERLVDLCNDVGLLAEGRRPALSQLLPSAFSHIALCNSAHNIADMMRPCEQRSGNGPLAADLSVFDFRLGEDHRANVMANYWEPNPWQCSFTGRGTR